MDPVSALGLAAASVQFISFAADTVSKYSNIRKAVNGGRDEILDIEFVYTRLGKLANDLQTNGCFSDEGASGQKVDQISTVQELGKKCKEECDELLKLVGKIRTKGGDKSRWKGFCAALMTVWKSTDVAELEKRLASIQQTLTLEICTISCQYHAFHQKNLSDLKEESIELNVAHAVRLDRVTDLLQTLGKQIENIQATAASSSSDSLGLTSLVEKFSQLSTVEESARKDHEILRSLGYQARAVRHNAIPKAHQTTLGWIFDQKASGFSKWLARDNGIFWVSGKPGSGKSTLMKFIADNQLTSQALQRWAGSHQAVLASHYFWSPGTAMQRSQEGLFRSILYGIFQHCQLLIQSCCEISQDQPGLGPPWTLQNLRKALHNLSKSQGLTVKICIFIDGLDEYEGDCFDLCQDLFRLADSPYIKLCVSSRPWNVFEDAFGVDPSRKIYIHDLTRDDIHSYVTSCLSEHPRWNHLIAEDSNAVSLSAEIVDRAQGVFLWVFLVIKELRKGLSNDDTLLDLQQRLYSFPTDLGPFFRHMLESVEDFYHEKMANTLRIAVEAREPLDAVMYNFQDEEYSTSDYALHMPTNVLSETALRSRRKQCARRLNGRTKGLLERRNDNIEFLHRTVRDFLRTREMADFLAAKSNKDFNPHLSILRAHVAFLKSSEWGHTISLTSDGPGSLHFCLEALCYAAILEKYADERTREKDLLVDQVDNCVPQGQWTRLPFRKAVLTGSLTGYMLWKLPKDPKYFDILKKPLLPLILDLPDNSEDKSLRKSLLQCAFQSGYSPNESIPGTCSAWASFLNMTIASIRGHGNDPPEALRGGLIPFFLRHGADPNVTVDTHLTGGPGRSLGWASLLLAFEGVNSNYLPRDQQCYLEALDSFIKTGAKTDEWVHQYFFDIFDLSKQKPIIQGSFLVKVAKRLILLSCDPKTPPKTLTVGIEQYFTPGAREEIGYFDSEGTFGPLTLTMSGFLKRGPDDLEIEGPKKPMKRSRIDATYLYENYSALDDGSDHISEREQMRFLKDLRP